jgi:FAD/FMN-containing dehydrogenase
MAAPSTIGRRSFVKLAAGAAVAGFHLGSQSWVAAAGRPPRSPFEHLPPLDGEVVLDDASRDAAGQDFGQLVFERPIAVLRPGSIDDVARMLRFARRNDIRVVGRGAGHTTFGQSQHAAGIAFDMTTLDSIGPVVGDHITVGAGCRWNEVLPATLAAQLMPPVLPDFIGQTVGGTLSVGGIGAMSFHHGAQVDHVISLVVVTGDGRIVECSDHHHRELFEMVLAGQGQVAVIAEATLRLVPAPTDVRVYDLVYGDLDSLLADLALLMDEGRFDQMESFVIPTGPDEWLYLLEAIGYHGPAGPPDDTGLLAGRHHVAAQQPADVPFLTWSSRVSGLRRQPHPWIDLLLPMSAAATFVRDVQQDIAPIATGDTYNLLLIPLRRSRFGRPLFRTQQEELGVGFDTLRALPPGLDAGTVIAFNEELYDRCTRVGGSHYPISAVRLDVDDWVEHYGEQWERLVAAKRRYDRDDVLAGGPDVLGAAR